MNNTRNRRIIVLSFAIFFGWTISFPYEGPVLYALAQNGGLNATLLNGLSVLFLGSGLLFGSYFTKNVRQAKKITLIVVSLAFAISLILPFFAIECWAVVLPVMSFVMGIFIPNVAYPIQSYTAFTERDLFASNMLIGGALVLIMARVLTINVAPMLAYGFIELMLLAGIILMFRLDLSIPPVPNPVISEKDKVPLKDFWIFFLFIFVITINSGIMFSIMYPYFAEFPLLASLYTDVPYILAIYLLARVIKINKFYFLYVGLLLIAIAFVLFSVMPQSALAVFIILTLMLFSSGIYDFFWWSTMLENFEIVCSPGMFLGAGLSLNIFGVWIGALIGNHFLAGEPKHLVAITGMLLVVICLVIILPLNLKLSRLLVHNRFMLVFQEDESERMNEAEREVNALLSNREKEVFQLLILGKHDKEICEELNIAKGTIKTHNRNIYKKLRVNSRAELIKKYSY